MLPLLQELAPKVALQQLALPLNDLQRLAGIATLKGFVWHANVSQLKKPRADYMQAVRDQMTAEEQVGQLLNMQMGTLAASAAAADDSRRSDHCVK